MNYTMTLGKKQSYPHGRKKQAPMRCNPCRRKMMIPPFFIQKPLKGTHQLSWWFFIILRLRLVPPKAGWA